ncbi:MAG: outer membrane beta-barrel protein [Cyclobacteriaceae bacterium]
MKKFITTTLLIALCLVTMESMAQRRGYGYGQSRVGISNIDLNVGWYQPSLAYLNNDSYLADIGASFGGGITANVGADMRFSDVLIGARVGYWADEASVQNVVIGGIDRDEKLGLLVLPISFQGKYEFHLGNPRNYRQQGLITIHPFVGVGVNYTLISQNYERVLDGVPESDRLNGRTITYSAIAGLKYTVAQNFDIGFEYQHVFGGFNQGFEVGDVVTTETVSLMGPSATLTLSYVLFGRTKFNMKRGKFR